LIINYEILPSLFTMCLKLIFKVRHYFCLLVSYHGSHLGSASILLSLGSFLNHRVLIEHVNITMSPVPPRQDLSLPLISGITWSLPTTFLPGFELGLFWTIEPVRGKLQRRWGWWWLSFWFIAKWSCQPNTPYPSFCSADTQDWQIVYWEDLSAPIFVAHVMLCSHRVKRPLPYTCFLLHLSQPAGAGLQPAYTRTDPCAPPSYPIMTVSFTIVLKPMVAVFYKIQTMVVFYKDKSTWLDVKGLDLHWILDLCWCFLFTMWSWANSLSLIYI
jgi:hypothetical protein